MTDDAADDPSAASAVVAVVLADGRVLEEEREGNGACPDLSVLAGALPLAPPLRLAAVRRSPGLWAVGARRLEVLALGGESARETIEVVFDGQERSVVVDGAPTLRGCPPLEALGARHGRAYVVTASRLVDDLWEVGSAVL